MLSYTRLKFNMNLNLSILQIKQKPNYMLKVIAGSNYHKTKYESFSFTYIDHYLLCFFKILFLKSNSHYIILIYKYFFFSIKNIGISNTGNPSSKSKY